MRAFASNSALRRLAIALVLFQAILPGAVSMAQAGGVDVGRFLCLTPGNALSEDARRYAQILAELLGEEAPADTETTGDCPLCILAKGKIFASSFEVALPAFGSVEPRLPAFQIAFVHRHLGPTLGGRAPPHSV